jgi:hypothetical protein
MHKHNRRTFAHEPVPDSGSVDLELPELQRGQSVSARTELSWPAATHERDLIVPPTLKNLKRELPEPGIVPAWPDGKRRRQMTSFRGSLTRVRTRSERL